MRLPDRDNAFKPFELCIGFERLHRRFDLGRMVGVIIDDDAIDFL